MREEKCKLRYSELEKVASDIVSELNRQRRSGSDGGCDFSGVGLYKGAAERFWGDQIPGAELELFEDELGFKRGADGFGQSGKELPRLSRREYLEHRLARRRNEARLVLKNKGAFDGFAFAKEDFTGFEGALDEDAMATSHFNSGELSTEKLSEAFCRDARRYDGAFERY